MRDTAATATGSDAGPPHGVGDEAEVLHPRRHPGRIVGGLIAIAVLAWLVVAFANSKIDWSVVADNLTAPTILKGAWHTVLISAAAMALGLVLGVIFAIMRLSRNPVLSSVAWLYVWLFRGTPVFLQLLIWFNLAVVFPTLSFPWLFSVSTTAAITPFVAALLGLGINEGAYLTEIIRGGIVSVDPGQTEAAAATGLPQRSIFRWVILPQALPAILPTLGNETIGMLKTSALAAAISYGELLNAAQESYYNSGRVMELLFVAAAWYLLAVSITSVGQYYLERWANRGRTDLQASIAHRAWQAMRVRQRGAA
jgi:polar amino acid transport system permease protein